MSSEIPTYKFDTRGQFRIEEDDHLLVLRCVSCEEIIVFLTSAAPDATQEAIDAHLRRHGWSAVGSFLAQALADAEHAVVGRWGPDYAAGHPEAVLALVPVAADIRLRLGESRLVQAVYGPR